MAANYSFHPEALLEFAEAMDYFLREASVKVADKFIDGVESAVRTMVAEPTRWRVVDEPEIRRYVLSRFPFGIYYRWEPQHQRVTIYAVMHCSREPGYWHQRIERVQATSLEPR